MFELGFVQFRVDTCNFAPKTSTIRQGLTCEQIRKFQENAICCLCSFFCEHQPKQGAKTENFNEKGMPTILHFKRTAIVCRIQKYNLYENSTTCWRVRVDFVKNHDFSVYFLILS